MFFPGLFIHFLIVGFAIFGVISLISSRKCKENKKSEDDASLEVLKMRFAKGEIEEEEFIKRLTLLKSEGTSRE